MKKRRIVVGVSGASGSPLAYDVLQKLHEIPYIETHVIFSDSAVKTMRYETDRPFSDFLTLSGVHYEFHDMGASIASGTFLTAGMVIVPCSMKTLGGLSGGYCDNLLLRAADVTLKEKRRLVLVTREAPLHEIHLQNMLKLARMGATILPPMLSYYQKEGDLATATRRVTEKILRALQIEEDSFYEWNPAENS